MLHLAVNKHNKLKKQDILDEVENQEVSQQDGLIKINMKFATRMKVGVESLYMKTKILEDYFFSSISKAFITAQILT